MEDIVKDVFVIQLTNKEGMKAFVCDADNNLGFELSGSIDGDTKLFYSWMAANQFGNRLKKYGSILILKMSDIINNPDKYNLSKAVSKNNAEEYYFLVGYTDDGVKNWIHYDKEKKKYIPRPQMVGACIWYATQTEEMINLLQEDKTLSIRKYVSEKIENSK
jgi:hypothetical protein